MEMLGFCVFVDTPLLVSSVESQKVLFFLSQVQTWRLWRDVTTR